MPAQGDVMQARWGSHGDRAAIVLTASSVLDAYEMTIEAFNLAETYRLPVVLLLDATLSHMRENMDVSRRSRRLHEHARPRVTSSSRSAAQSSCRSAAAPASW